MRTPTRPLFFKRGLSTRRTPRARSLLCRRLAPCAAFGACRLAGRCGTVAGAALPGGGVRVPRERKMRRRGAAFALQRAERRALAFPRRLPMLHGGGTIGTRLAPRGRRGRAGCRQLHPGASRFRQADRNGLLGRPGAMLALADVFHFLAYEFAGLCAGRFSLALVARDASHRGCFRHVICSFRAYWIATSCARRCSRSSTGSVFLI
jgi:hypothetical protein